MRKRKSSPLLRYLKALCIHPCPAGVHRLLAAESDEAAILAASDFDDDAFRLEDVRWTERVVNVDWLDGEDARRFVLQRLAQFRHAEAVARCITHR